MKKPDEVKLRELIYSNKDKDYVFYATTLMKQLDIPEKRMYYLLHKLAREDKIEYGTSIRFFWRTFN